MIYEESLIKVELKIHLLSIVLVQRPNVLVQITLVVNSMQTLIWSDNAIMTFLSFFAIITDPLISHRFMLDNLDFSRWVSYVRLLIKILNILISIHVVIHTAKPLQSLLHFHLNN